MLFDGKLRNKEKLLFHSLDKNKCSSYDVTNIKHMFDWRISYEQLDTLLSLRRHYLSHHSAIPDHRVDRTSQ